MNAKGKMVAGTLPSSSTVTRHPVSLAFTVYFDESNPQQIFPTHRMKVPLNRYLGRGTHMYVAGVTRAELKEICGEGEEKLVGKRIATDDDGSDISSEEDD